MWIKKAVFKNFGPHELLEVELAQGLVGIFGPNGVGKSMLLNGMYAALTNDFGRFAGVKTDNIKDTAGEDEESSIFIEAEHDGMEFTLLRSLRPAKSELRIKGRPAGIFKTGEIQQELEDHLGVDKKLIDTYIFVNQGGMFDFLSQTAGKRAETYQHLCGTVRAEEIHKAVGDMLDNENLPTEVIDNSDEVRANLAANEDKLKKAKVENKEASKGLLSDEEVETAEGTIKRRGEFLRLSQSIKGLVGQAEALSPRIEVAQNSFDSKQKLATDIEIAADGMSEAAGNAAVALLRFDEYEERLADQKREDRKRRDKEADLNKKLDSLVDPDEVELHEEDDQLGEIQGQLRDLHTKHKQDTRKLQNLRKGDRIALDLEIGVTRVGDHIEYDLAEEGKEVELGGETTSEAVLSSVEACMESASGDLGDPAAAKAFEKVLLENDGKRQKLEARVTAVEDTREAKRSRDNTVRTNVIQRAANQSQLDDLQAMEEPDRLKTPVEDKENLQSIVDDAKELSDNLKKAETLANHARIGLVELETELKGIDDRMLKESEEREKNKVSEEATTKAQDRLDEHTATRVVKAGILERMSTLADQIIADEDLLETLESQLARQAKAIKFADRLRGIKKVMHRRQLPQAVAQENLEDMEVDINEVLHSFGDPFWIEAAEDLSFNVHFPGEPVKVAGRLSGGQKGVLAVAFRAAVSNLFSAEIGMMCLDEPTAGMDDENVSLLGEALTLFGAEVRDKRQVIMITHADALRSAFDQIVELGAAA